jgi:hypothetical protein
MVEYPKKTIDLSQVTGKLYHIIFIVYTSSWTGFKLRHISIGFFVVYIDTGSSVPGVPSKSRDLVDENNKTLTEWKWIETTVLFTYIFCLIFLKGKRSAFMYIHFCISDIRQIVGYRTPVFIQQFPWRDVSILQLLIIYRIYDYDMLTLSQ